MLVRSDQYQLGTKIQVDIRLSKGYQKKNNKNKNEYVGNLLYDDISDIKIIYFTYYIPYKITSVYLVLNVVYFTML